jgi:hypothetical protein
MISPASPVNLSSRAVAALWALLAADLTLAGWLLAVRSGAAPGCGPLLDIATLGDHPVLTLTLSELSAAALAVALPMTRGPSRTAGPRLALITGGAVLGAIAVAGILVIAVGAVVVLLLVVGLVVGLVVYPAAAARRR